MLGGDTNACKLGSLRYDLSKLRAKGLVEKLPHSRRSRLLPQGYQICVVYLKLFEKIYAPLTAGILERVPGDRQLPAHGIGHSCLSIASLLTRDGQAGTPVLLEFHDLEEIAVVVGPEAQVNWIWDRR